MNKKETFNFKAKIWGFFFTKYYFMAKSISKIVR